MSKQSTTKNKRPAKRSYAKTIKTKSAKTQATRTAAKQTKVCNNFFACGQRSNARSCFIAILVIVLIALAYAISAEMILGKV